MEKKIIFSSDNFRIAGLLDMNKGDKGVVVTHPHPVYGGDMYNFVVESIVNTYKKKGYATLRFNFRGTGESGGSYDNGIGEQNDVHSALSYLLSKGIKQVDLAGYSFGAWVNALAARNEIAAQNTILVSPPVGFLDFKNISSITGLRLVVTGSFDDIAPPDLIKKMLPAWNKNARFEVVKGANHFYSGYEKTLESILSLNI